MKANVVLVLLLEVLLAGAASTQDPVTTTAKTAEDTNSSRTDIETPFPGDPDAPYSQYETYNGTEFDDAPYDAPPMYLGINDYRFDDPDMATEPNQSAPVANDSNALFEIPDGRIYEPPSIVVNNGSKLVLNGMPTFCSFDAFFVCGDIPLNRCPRCSMGKAVIFAIAVTILALCIILSNALVIFVLVKGANEFGNYGKIKVSLAVSDLLTGLFLLMVTLPHFSFTLRSTAAGVFKYVLEMRNTPRAIVGGVYYLLLFTSSLYHLIYLATQRLYAIKWPIVYKNMKSRTVYFGILLVWALATLAAVSPLFLPRYFSFGYFHLTFLYDVTAANFFASKDVLPMTVFLLIVFLIPFVFMTILSAVTGVLTRNYIRKHRQRSSHASQMGKSEAKVVITLVAMQVGFSITLLPLFVVTVYSYTGQLRFQSISTPYLVCFYLAMSNSLVNVLVYSAVDENFRKSVKTIFSSCYSSGRRRLSSSYVTGTQNTTAVFKKKPVPRPESKSTSRKASTSV